MTIDVSEVIQEIQQFRAELPNMLRDGLERVLLKIEGDAKRKCVGETGLLRASITHTIEDAGEGLIGYVGSNLDYAPFYHQGTGIYALEGNGRKEVPWVYYSDKLGRFVSTHGIQPHPFLQNAVDENMGNALEYFRWGVGNHA